MLKAKKNKNENNKRTPNQSEFAWQTHDSDSKAKSSL